MSPLLNREYVAIAICAVVAVLGPAILLAPENDAPPEVEVLKLSTAKPRAVDAELPSAILEFPLFHAGRAPLVLENATAEAQETAAAPPSPPPPILVGVVARRKGKAIALAKNAAGETVSLTVGDQVDGWAVSAIGASAVTFDQADRRETIALDFRNKEKGAAAAASNTGVPIGTSPSISNNSSGALSVSNAGSSQ